jgi:hypothetical protein
MYGFGYIQPSIQPGAIDIQSGVVGSGDLAPNVVNSGNVSSGAIMGAAGGGPFNIASGTLTWNDIGSGSIRSGHLASGQVGFRHIALNAINSGNIGSGAILGAAGGGAINIASGTLTWSDLGSGAIQSGHVASGQLGQDHYSSGSIAGLLGGGFSIRSGTFGPNDIGSGAILSGHVASGQIGFRHIAVNAVNSGNVGSGAILGAAGGGYRNISSGTIGTNDIGLGAINSGHIGSGQVGRFQLSSGAGNVQAWVNFNSSGGAAPTLIGAMNVTSVTRNNTGDFTIFWSSGFATRNGYAVVATAANGFTRVGCDLQIRANMGSGSCSLSTYVPNTAGLSDPDLVCVIAVGAPA